MAIFCQRPPGRWDGELLSTCTLGTELPSTTFEFPTTELSQAQTQTQRPNSNHLSLSAAELSKLCTVKRHCVLPWRHGSSQENPTSRGAEILMPGMAGRPHFCDGVSPAAQAPRDAGFRQAPFPAPSLFISCSQPVTSRRRSSALPTGHDRDPQNNLTRTRVRACATRGEKDSTLLQSMRSLAMPPGLNVTQQLIPENVAAQPQADQKAEANHRARAILDPGAKAVAQPLT
jgi:hypothetical protein